MYEKRHNNNNNARNKKIISTTWGIVIVVALAIAGLLFHLSSQRNEYTIQDVGWRREIPVMEYRSHTRRTNKRTRIVHSWDRVKTLYEEDKGKDESLMKWPSTEGVSLTSSRKLGERKQSYWVSYINDKNSAVKGYFEDKDLFDIAEEGKTVVVDGFGQVKEIK